MTYYAHTHEDGIEHYEPLESHLHAVANLAGHFANAFNAKSLGEQIGLWHDAGKYSSQFQNYLIEAGKSYWLHLDDNDDSPAPKHLRKFDHATAGAKLAQQHINFKPLANIFSYCIAGHHTGLPNWDNDPNTSLFIRLLQDKPETLNTLQNLPTKKTSQRCSKSQSNHRPYVQKFL